MAKQQTHQPDIRVTGRFETAVREYASLMRSAVYGVLGAADELDDVVQQAWLKAWRHREELFRAENPAGWLYRVARRTALDVIRHRRRKRSLWERLTRQKPPMPEPPAESELDHSEQTAQIQRAIAELPEKYRTVLLLRAFESMSYKAIAEFLTVPVATVETRLLRARKLLQTKLRQRGVL